MSVNKNMRKRIGLDSRLRGNDEGWYWNGEDIRMGGAPVDWLLYLIGLFFAEEEEDVIIDAVLFYSDFVLTNEFERGEEEADRFISCSSLESSPQ